jgi:hypothetical protein
MNSFVLTMWLLGAGILGSSPGGAVLLAHVRCQLRSLPALLATGDGATGCPCGKDCDQDVEDKDAADKDVEDKDVEDKDACDGCGSEDDEHEEGAAER